MDCGSFRQDVLDAFGGVIANYGFGCTAADDMHVRLETADVLLFVTYDRARSFEVAVEVSQRKVGGFEPAVPYNLGEVFRCLGVPNAGQRWFFQSSDYAAAKVFLHDVAGILEPYGAELLRGENSVFERLARQRAKEAAAYTHSISLQQVRSAAEKAWREKDYGEYVRLMEPCRDSLRDSERRRLACARSHATVPERDAE